MLRRLFEPRAETVAGRQLYAAVTAKARDPALYLDGGVPDTNEGRFELYTLHLALVLRRLRGQGREAQGASIGAEPPVLEQAGQVAPQDVERGELRGVAEVGERVGLGQEPAPGDGGLHDRARPPRNCSGRGRPGQAPGHGSGEAVDADRVVVE